MPVKLNKLIFFWEKKDLLFFIIKKKNRTINWPITNKEAYYDPMEDEGGYPGKPKKKKIIGQLIYEWVVFLFLSLDFSHNYVLTCFICFDVLCCAVRENESKQGKLVVVGLAAGVLTLGPIDDASAGRIDRRFGSHYFSSSTPATKRRAITKKPK